MSILHHFKEIILNVGWSFSLDKFMKTIKIMSDFLLLLTNEWLIEYRT
jgi:hypothetical protein